MYMSLTGSTHLRSHQLAFSLFDYYAHYYATEFKYITPPHPRYYSRGVGCKVVLYTWVYGLLVATLRALLIPLIYFVWKKMRSGGNETFAVGTVHPGLYAG